MVDSSKRNDGSVGPEIHTGEEGTTSVNELIKENFLKILNWLAKLKGHPLTIVECGCIRQCSFDGHADGLSTMTIARWIQHSGVPHRFYSFELDIGNQRAARDFLHNNGRLDKYVNWALGDAGLLLQHFEEHLDFAYLDAGADPVQNLLQYERVKEKLREPGIVIIDDVFSKLNANRGLLTVPIARLEGRKVGKLLDRMAVIAMGKEAENCPLLDGDWL